MHLNNTAVHQVEVRLNEKPVLTYNQAMSHSDNPQRDQAVLEIREIFKQVRHSLKINHNQTRDALLFDMLRAVENAAILLNKAWKVGEIYKITDDWMRQEFIDVFSYFIKVKKDLRKEIKHIH